MEFFGGEKHNDGQNELDRYISSYDKKKYVWFENNKDTMMSLLYLDGVKRQETDDMILWSVNAYLHVHITKNIFYDKKHKIYYCYEYLYSDRVHGDLTGIINEIDRTVIYTSKKSLLEKKDENPKKKYVDVTKEYGKEFEKNGQEEYFKEFLQNNKEKMIIHHDYDEEYSRWTDTNIFVISKDYLDCVKIMWGYKDWKAKIL